MSICNVVHILRLDRFDTEPMKKYKMNEFYWQWFNLNVCSMNTSIECNKRWQSECKYYWPSFNYNMRVAWRPMQSVSMYCSWKKNRTMRRLNIIGIDVIWTFCLALGQLALRGEWKTTSLATHQTQTVAGIVLLSLVQNIFEKTIDSNLPMSNSLCIALLRMSLLSCVH